MVYYIYILLQSAAGFRFSYDYYKLRQIHYKLS